MPERPKILVVYNPQNLQVPSELPDWESRFQIVHAPTLPECVNLLETEHFDGVYFALLAGPAVKTGLNSLSYMLQNHRILEGMPDGVAMLNIDNTIVWANKQIKEWSGREEVMGEDFYSVLGQPEILGPDFCPMHTVLATNQPSNSLVRCSDGKYYSIHVAPIAETSPDHEANHATPATDKTLAPKYLICTVHDVTKETLQQHKLEAIHKAGTELSGLTPKVLAEVPVAHRKEYLKSNILLYTKDLLKFNVVEIRILDSNTKKLIPLLADGMTPEAEQRVLYASQSGNGVTGYVAATGKSYLCDNTTKDPLFIEGSREAKSSLTVPLKLHDHVIGTFNVESPKASAFSESDLQFLESFALDVAQAVNTLFLLETEIANTAVRSVEAIHSAVAVPIDKILNDAVNIIEKMQSVQLEPELRVPLENILRNARTIKQVIQNVGQTMAPSEATLVGNCKPRPLLRGRQILVVDADENERKSAHTTLEPYGCIVETAQNAAVAYGLANSKKSTKEQYDVFISKIRLPDMNAYEFLNKLKTDIGSPVPFMMIQDGWDIDHIGKKAIEEGLMPAYALVVKNPRSPEHMLSVIEKVISSHKVSEA